METFPYPNKFSGLWECHGVDSCPEFRVQNASFCSPAVGRKPVREQNTSICTREGVRRPIRVQEAPFCIPSGAYRPGLIHTMLVNNERYSFCKFQQPLTERALEKYPELYEEWLKNNNQ